MQFRLEGQRQFQRATLFVARVSLLLPWISINVITEALPETRLLLPHELKTSHPLCTLPEIKMRDKQPCRPAVFRGEVLAVEAKGDPRLSVFEIAQRDVCGVVAVRMGHDVGSLRLEVCKQRVERDAFPGSAELGPSRYTVQVDSRSFCWQLPERFPVPSPQQRIALIPDRKVPVIERNVRRGPSRQDRKVRGEILPWRKLYAFRLPAGKTSGDDTHL